MEKTKYPRVTVGAIIEKEGKILLTKRSKNMKRFAGYWCIPGGHIENGERAEDAVKREVKEETGLDFTPEFFGYFNEIFPEQEWYAVALLFSGKGEGEVIPNEEVSECKWATPEDAINEKLAFAHNEALEAWIKKDKAREVSA